MHDIRLIRDDPESFDAALARRGVAPASASILALDTERRAVATRMQEAQNRRNEASKAIGKAMGQGDTETAEALKAEVAELKQTLPELEGQERELGAKLQDELSRLPNLPLDEVPDGEDESANVELRRVGTPKTEADFGFKPKEHYELGEGLGA